VNVYKVYNGYMTDSYIFCIVIAPNEEKAKEAASERFKEDAKNEYYEERVKQYKERGWDISSIEEYNQEERYWTKLNVELVCENVDKLEKAYASEIEC
jgi:hypothetical protein